jgi:hypothetical protein
MEVISPDRIKIRTCAGLDIESGGNDRGFDLKGAICNLDTR